MSKNNDWGWKTKYGHRRVRQETPTLEEAIAAAQGMADGIDEQTRDRGLADGSAGRQVRAELMKLPQPRRDHQVRRLHGPASAPRTVVVERKISRAGCVGAGSASGSSLVH